MIIIFVKNAGKDAGTPGIFKLTINCQRNGLKRLWHRETMSVVLTDAAVYIATTNPGKHWYELAAAVALVRVGLVRRV